MDQAIRNAYATSFRGQLHAMGASGRVPLRLSRSRDKWHWGITPQDDWLMAGGNGSSIYMDFTFDSLTDDRLHYHISIPGRERPKKLGKSLNHYLGFYERAEVHDYWKIEPLQLTDDGLICHLRDHEGYRTGAIQDTPHRSGQTLYLLNTREGDTLTFLLEQLA
ncbi:hypothetical protein ACU5P1_22430 [Pseudomonas plecoglossicida]|uniref:Uncharacterized protein n=1 Tax=Pseudomonas plecoglossicida TaxID=70775 RepID=A0AAD0VTX2_PSEDL|nr:hypothetical protein [Pseudomonas plecoglossicida]AXM96582.1 hypothetical protein DVB73_12730 [Pseudomonas plecoglossicida]QLB57329.1 hypothetical protein HAV28_22215 [Pseudomonas plecoglossicida]GLR39478.1 hypothetical protein GCM10011247_48770 [Pseudomonas plecoglossicida]